MAYQLCADMALREYAVTRAIEELSRTQDTFNYDDIAHHIGCGQQTVYRAMKRLLETQQVTRIGSNRGGYRYEVTRVPAYA